MQSDDDENRKLALLALLRQRDSQPLSDNMNLREDEIRNTNNHRLSLENLLHLPLSDVEYLNAYQTLAVHEQQLQDAQQTLRRWTMESSLRPNQPTDLALHMLSSQDRDRDAIIHRILEEVRLRDTLRLLDATVVGQPLSNINNVAGAVAAGSLSAAQAGAHSLPTPIDSYTRALALSSAATATGNDPGTAAYLSLYSSAGGMAQRIVASALSTNRDARLNPSLQQQHQDRLTTDFMVGYNRGGIVSVDQVQAPQVGNKMTDSLRKRKTDASDDEKKPAAAKKSKKFSHPMFPLPSSKNKRTNVDTQQQHSKLSSFRETWSKLGEKHDPDTQKEVFLRQLSRGIR